MGNTPRDTRDKPEAKNCRLSPIRITGTMRDAIERAAKLADLGPCEWVRAAIIEKLKKG
jgi:hypothetical protein